MAQQFSRHPELVSGPMPRCWGTPRYTNSGSVIEAWMLKQVQHDEAAL
jgi:hypothetical protein